MSLLHLAVHKQMDMDKGNEGLQLSPFSEIFLPFFLVDIFFVMGLC